jgi:hypothetical protein
MRFFFLLKERTFFNKPIELAKKICYTENSVRENVKRGKSI